jgi:V/A-type H+-transporting ATPase subunit E
MEELRSTEILDKEILEDARKKAEKTLAAAAGECKAILDGVDARVQKTLKEKEEAYAKKIDALKRDKDAALPLEKKRYLVSFEGTQVINAVNGYLGSLSKEKRLSLIGSLLEKYKNVIGSKRFKAVAFGVDAADAERLLKTVFSGGSLISCETTIAEKIGASAVEGIAVREGIILETEDGIRARATLDEIIAKLLDTDRYELTAALFGGRLPE